MFLIKFLLISLLFINFTFAATINGTTYKINKVEYTINGSSYTQTTSGTAVTSISNATPVYIGKVTLDNGTVLDNFATNNISVNLHSEYLDMNDAIKGVIFNQIKLPANNANAQDALNTTNIKDYVTNDDEVNERLVMDITYNGYHITGSDYIFFHERNGNNAFKIQALDIDGNPVGDILIFPATSSITHGWDPGFKIGGPIGPNQHPWMGVIKASQFGVSKIYGLRQWATGADLKFYAVGEESFSKDFGDAPVEYPHISHKISSELYLGDITPDNETDQQSSADATGDGADDNDGVTTLPTLTVGSTSYTVPVKVFNNTGKNAYITAWIDFNRNNKFEFKEALNVNDLSVPSSASSQTINVVWDNSFSATQFSNLTAGKNIMRIRLSTSRILRCDSEHYSDEGNYQSNYFVSPDGEVEDYEITAMEPFICQDNFYVSNQHNLETGSTQTDKNWLHTINRDTPPYSFNSIGNGFSSQSGGYNAIGYRLQDNFIYGMYGNILVKIDSNGVVKELGEVEGFNQGQVYAGEFDRDGYYYVKEYASDHNKMYKIDVIQKKVIQTITLSQSVRFWDMAIDETGDYFYAMLIQNGDDDSSYNNNKVAKIKISDGTITTIGNSHSTLSSYISLVFSDIDGDIFMMSNENGFYKVNKDTGALQLISSTQNLTFYNDGTSCADANISVPPILSISDAEIVEGDSGIKYMKFIVSLDKASNIDVTFNYQTISGNNNDVVENATSPSDYTNTSGSTSINANTLFTTISVPINGDEVVEKDEQFRVVITNVIGANVSRAEALGTIINDDMKLRIERTNNNQATPQEQRSSFYTQISGRDFDYSIVSYGQNDRANIIEDITVKVELMDNNTRDENNVLYTGYKYIASGSRIDILSPDDDLAIPRATRKSSFSISYLKDVNGSILHGNHTSNYEATKNSNGNSELSNRASDHFAIRPATYKIVLKDENNQSVTYTTNKNPTSDLNLVAGYDYRLKVEALNYDGSTNETNYTVSSEELNVTLDFDETGTTSCKNNNTADIEDYTFSNGQLNESFSHDNVGKYTLHIEDINWTDIDKNETSLGCVLGSSSNTADSSGKFGCNISSDEGDNFTDIDMTFQAYEFKLTNTAIVNPFGKDYVYMNNLEKNAAMGIDIFTNIIAQGYKHNVLTNFTTGCFAQNVDINLTTDLSDINKSRYGIKSYNGNSLLNEKIEVKELNQTLTIPSNKFLDINEGNSSIKIRYNIGRDHTQPLNPVKVLFQYFDANSRYFEDSKPKASSINSIINKSQIFYYARVASSQKRYVEMAGKKDSIADIQIELFCRTATPTQDWCRDTMNIKNISNYISNKSYKGWYLAKEHNSSAEGSVSNITAYNSTTHSSTDIELIYPTPIKFVNGKYGKIRTVSKEDDYSITVEITSDEWLKYNNNSYEILLKEKATYGGVGKTGYVLNKKVKDSSHDDNSSEYHFEKRKMSW